MSYETRLLRRRQKLRQEYDIYITASAFVGKVSGSELPVAQELWDKGTTLRLQGHRSGENWQLAGLVIGVLSAISRGNRSH